ncbi:oxidized low-density lipoprotein receptor 1-like [Hemitrygon akajei]|uniref:oxidized low-density lipoprotein receptor 1-like n=1 Tax=Hemitrygon akajei TaxID=2704970 RepID=UPI003BF9DA72
MDQSVSYMTVKFGKNDSRSLSRAEPDVSYAEVNFKTPSAPRVRADRDGLNSTYSDLNFRRKEPCIDESECPRIAQGPGRLSTITQTAAQERESKVKIGNRPYRLICLLCLVTAALIVIVVGLSIHVSQIRQSKITSDRNCHEINSSVESEASPVKFNLTDHQFTEMEKKYRSVNETKAQICELLTSRRAQAFSQNWIRNEGPCYFISTVKTSYDEAKQNCSKSDSKLLEINSAEEENFVAKAIRDEGISHWIGKCKDRKVASQVMFRLNGGDPECDNFVKKSVRDQGSSYWIGKCNYGRVASNIAYQMKAGVFECIECGWYPHFEHCSEDQRRFICEKSAPLCSDLSEKIQDLCQQSMGST